VSIFFDAHVMVVLGSTPERQLNVNLWRCTSVQPIDLQPHDKMIERLRAGSQFGTRLSLSRRSGIAFYRLTQPRMYLRC
jgi:hypothetical protein